MGGNVFDGTDNGTIHDLPSLGSNKRILVLFIVDATKSMDGIAIGQVNHALTEVVSDLRNFATDNMVTINVGIMSFSNSIKWEMKPDDIANIFTIPKIAIRPGQTQYGVVYHELNRMLKKDELLKGEGKQGAPVIIFLTDGAPTDNYKYDLDELKKNGYFMLANKAVVIMGEGASDPKAKRACLEFTMEDNKVLTTSNMAEIVNNISVATMHTLRGTTLQEEKKTDVGNTAKEGSDIMDLIGRNPVGSSGNNDPDPFGTNPAGSSGNNAPDPFGTNPAGSPENNDPDPFGTNPAGSSGNNTPDPFGTDPAGLSGTDTPDPFGMNPSGNDNTAPSQMDESPDNGVGVGDLPETGLEGMAQDNTSEGMNIPAGSQSSSDPFGFMDGTDPETGGIPTSQNFPGNDAGGDGKASSPEGTVNNPYEDNPFGNL